MTLDSSSCDFQRLLKELEQEYDRVCFERDSLRRTSASSDYDDTEDFDELPAPGKGRHLVSLGDWSAATSDSTIPTSSSMQVLPMAEDVDSIPAREKVICLDSNPSSLSTESEDDLQTPRALRAIHGPSLASDTIMGSRCEHDTAQDDFDRQIELHTRWPDLYVANEMNGMQYPSAEQDGCGSRSMLVSRVFDTSKRTSRFGTAEGVEDEKGPLSARFAKYTFQVPFGPQDNFTICWGMLCGPILMHDAVVIPLQVGFDMEPSPLVTTLMVVYWTFDIFVRFNSAITQRNTIVVERKLVAKKYLGCQFWIDVILVALDISSLIDLGSDKPWFKLLRITRIPCMLRLFKLANVQAMLEDTFVDIGGDIFIVLFAVLQTLIGIFLLAHLATCGWYLLGHENWKHRTPAWLDWLMDEQVSDTDAYIHSIYWVVGHLVGGQTNPAVAPVSSIERVYAVSLVGLSLLVMGCGISKMTNTIADLGRLHAETKDTRRKLVQVLRASGADGHLASRILRFGMHVFSRKASLKLEDTVKGLLSQALVNELTHCQRSPYLIDHPLFGSISIGSPEVFLMMCSQFSPLLFAESDVIFRPNSRAECMYVTLSGEFLIEADLGVRMLTDEVHFSGQRYLSEISLFSNIVHMTTLKTASFGDAFTLTGDDFAMSVGKSPRCVAQVYLYATRYVAMLQDLRRSEHEDFGHVKVDFEIVPQDFSSAVLNALEDKTTKRRSREEMVRLESLCCSEISVDGFLDKFMKAEPSNFENVVDALPEAFGELHDQGIYSLLQMEQEKHRSVAAMTSAICLIKDDFDSFTCSQGSKKLERDQWDEMQLFVKWANMSKDMIHAMLVFLAIRGIGKAQAFLQAMDKHCRTPEDVVVKLMHQSSNVMPSFEMLAPEGQMLVETAFSIHRSFNFAQLLQGENTPSHVRMLQEMVEREGEHVLKFYLFSLVCVMCGLRGAESQKGSLFMDSVNARTLMAGIHVLQRLSHASPCGMYWGYIGLRARALGLTFEELEHMAIARLACLTRTTQTDVELLQTEWYRLCTHDREAFTQHLLADGLSKVAVVFTFLPSYLANAKQNSSVGLYRALVVLAELMDHLEDDGYIAQCRRNVLTVSLQDLAEFTARVSSVSVFMAVHVHSSIVSRAGQLDFLVSAKHKQHALHHTWKDDPTHEMTLRMRRMDRKVETVNTVVERLHRQGPPPLHGAHAHSGADP